MLSSSYDSLPPAIADQMRSLRVAYIQKLDDKMATIEQLWEVLRGLDEDTPTWFSTAGELYRLVHSLAGSGTTFGLPQVSEQARTSEAVLKELHESGVWGKITPVDVAEHLNALRSVVNEVTATSPIFNVEPAEFISSLDFLRQPTTTRSLCLLEEHAGDSQALIAPLEAFGFEVRLFERPSQLKDVILAGSADAIILNVRRSPGTAAIGGESLVPALAELGALKGAHIPLIWICEQNDLTARLQAVHLGGRAFFNSPVDSDDLIGALEQLSQHDEAEAYRILIVDDEPSLTKLYGLVLSQRGFEVSELNHPLEIMKPLVEFRPDLILMDVYMKDCNGVELAAAIRQQEAFVSLPLVFLSGEKDLDRQIDAMSRGGDEFLIKPIKTEHLVSVVSSRAARGRALRRLMERDSLTGLLNHTKFKEQLNIEIDRVKRLGHTISLVMLDIDYFKKVNDTYGHAAGDRVLKSLARTLTQRLRQTDLVGRYGGEEFALVLNGTTGEQALQVVDELRRLFAGLAHHVGDREFYTTFSAGIASAPPLKDAASLSEAADQALYRAKQEGRDRVILDELSGQK